MQKFTANLSKALNNAKEVTSGVLKDAKEMTSGVISNAKNSIQTNVNKIAV